MHRLKTVCLNLEKDVQRRSNIIKNFSHIFDIEFFPAVNGNNVNIHQSIDGIILETFNINNQSIDLWKHDPTKRLKKMSHGEFGCAISHYLCINSLDTTKHEYFLILEDDSIIEQQNTNDFLHILKDLPPSDMFDICLLSNCIKWLPLEVEKLINTNYFFVKKQMFNMANAYIITKKGIDKYKNLIKTGNKNTIFRGSINVPADDFLSNANLEDNLQTISCLKRYIQTGNFQSSIWNCIQQNEDYNNVIYQTPKDLSAFITMKTLGLQGRLANQMFQFAFLKNLQLKCNITLKLNTNILIKNNFRLFEAFDNLNFCELPDTDVNSISQNIEEDQTHFNDYSSHILNQKTNFSGYFQSLKYIDDFEDVIKTSFTFKSDITESSIQYIQKIKKYHLIDLVIGLHCRLGDQLYTNENERVYPIISQDYINKSLEYICLKHPHVKIGVIVFTDSIIECKKLYTHSMFLEFESNKDVNDMCCLSLCDCIVTSSSTFSWFAAYLSKPTTTVVYPKEWFNKKLSRVCNIDTKSLFPKSWKSL